MQMERLFQVLVVGGAIFAGTAMTQGNPQFPEGSMPTPGVSDGELTLILCDQEGACVTDCNGHKKVKDGFTCCWNTSCE